MALTKPAGCFLQVLAIPVLLMGGALIVSCAEKGGSLMTGFLGVFLFTLGFWLLKAGRVPVATQPPSAGPTKACPYCAEQIQVAAKVCRFCGRDIPS